MSTRNPRRSRGVSLLELTIATGIFLGVMLMVQEVISTSQRAQVYIAARDRASQHSANLIADLRGAGLASRRVYQDDAEGRSYLAALDMTGMPLLADARLPVIDPLGRLELDGASAPRTGNALLLACEDRPQEFTATGGRYRVDIVRFFGVYPTRLPDKVVEAMPDRIDLVRFASRQYVDKASLDQITVALDRSDVVQALHALGITRCWVAGAAIDSAFFQLNTDGSISTTPIASPVIDAPPDALPRLMIGATKASIAPNSPALRVPSFARTDVLKPAFPSGFEVKVVGPSGGRQVLVRLTLVCGVRDGPDADSTTVRQFSVRDL
jgi:hypothetical protein